MKIFIITCALSIIQIFSTSAAVQTTIGQAFYLPKTDLLGEYLYGGFNFTKGIPSSCIHNTAANEVDAITSYYKDTASFYRSLTSSSSLSADLQSDYTLGVTLDVTTQNIAGSERTISGTTLMVYSKASVGYVDSDCLHNVELDDIVRQDFEKLTPVTTPWTATNWTGYDLFLQSHGSHIVSQITYGSSLFQHNFAEQSRSYAERDFTVRACVDFLGPTEVGKVNVSACSGISETEAQAALSMDTSSRLIIRGGTNETRGKLYKNRTIELISQFLDEADTTHEPIQYKFVPIWTLLQSKYIGTPHFYKAVNLEAYYKGFKNFKCDEQKISDVVVQKFDFSEYNSADHPDYQCKLAPIGCKSDDDCHYRSAFWCECRGETCIRYKEETLDTGVIREVPYAFTEQGWGWQGCTRKVFKCYCWNPNTIWKTIWTLSSDTSQMKSLINQKAQALRRFISHIMSLPYFLKRPLIF